MDDLPKSSQYSISSDQRGSSPKGMAFFLLLLLLTAVCTISAHSELKFRRKECENFTLPIYFQKSEEVAKISSRKLLLRRRQFAYLIRFLTSLNSAVRGPGGYILRLFYLHGYIQVDLIQTHSLSE